MIERNNCPNLNHSNTNAQVRFCPSCGEMVNGNITIKECSEEEHSKRRRDINNYCVDCGEQLIH